jgi:hypothetical protein
MQHTRVGMTGVSVTHTWHPLLAPVLLLAPAARPSPSQGPHLGGHRQPHALHRSPHGPQRALCGPVHRAGQRPGARSHCAAARTAGRQAKCKTGKTAEKIQREHEAKILPWEHCALDMASGFRPTTCCACCACLATGSGRLAGHWPQGPVQLQAQRAPGASGSTHPRVPRWVQWRWGAQQNEGCSMEDKHS